MLRSGCAGDVRTLVRSNQVMTAAFITYNPIVKVHLGPLAISPHGVGIAVGFLAGARLLLPETRRRGIPDLVVRRSNMEMTPCPCGCGREPRVPNSEFGKISRVNSADLSDLALSHGLPIGAVRHIRLAVA